MIEGIKIDVTSEELKELLKERIDYHTMKRDSYTKRSVSLEEIDDDPNTAVSMDPVQGLRKKAKSHGEKAAFFSFLYDHVIPDETYRLTESDLSRLEIISRYF